VLEQNAASEKNAAAGDGAADRGIRNHFRMLFYSEENRDAYLAGAKDLVLHRRSARRCRRRHGLWT